MKPHRLAMTHHLVLGYELHKKMDVYVSRAFTIQHMHYAFSLSAARKQPEWPLIGPFLPQTRVPPVTEPAHPSIHDVHPYLLTRESVPQREPTATLASVFHTLPPRDPTRLLYQRHVSPSKSHSL